MSSNDENHELKENLKAIDRGLEDLKAGRTVDAREAMHQIAEEQGLQSEVAVGIKQLDDGQYTEYNDETLGQLAEDIKAKGRKRLAKEYGLKLDR